MKATVSALAIAALLSGVGALAGAGAAFANDVGALDAATAERVAAAGADNRALAAMVIDGDVVSPDAAAIIARGVGGGASAAGIVGLALSENPDLPFSEVEALVEAASKAAFGDAAGILTTAMAQYEGDASQVARLAAAATRGVKAGCGDTCGQVIGSITSIAVLDPAVRGDKDAIELVRTSISDAAGAASQVAENTGDIEVGSVPSGEGEEIETGTVPGGGAGVFASGPTGTNAGSESSGGSPSPS
ncbi:MAG: hypothetical protein AAGM38_07750 [Pseudomonadota bacterium]